jgi:hypothetical protein
MYSPMAMIIGRRTYAPHDGTNVRYRYANHNTEQSGQKVGDSRTKPRLGGHTAGLEVNGRQVAKRQNDNGRPVPLQNKWEQLL